MLTRHATPDKFYTADSIEELGEIWRGRMEEVVIVGAGVAGLAAAVALRRVGLRAVVLERSDGLRTEGTAVTLAPNAWRALEALAVAPKLRPLYPTIHRSIIFDVPSATTLEVPINPGGTGVAEVRTVHRTALLEALAAELPPGSIRFCSKPVAFDTQTPSPVTLIRLADGTILQAKIVIGCDGVHSRVARWLGHAEPLHSGRSAVRGLARFPGGHGLSHEVRQFVDGDRRAGFVPLNSTTLYWFLTCKSTFAAEEIGGPEKIRDWVLHHKCADFPAIYKDAVRHSDIDTVSWAPLLFRAPWSLAFGSIASGGVAVAGDAMHPMLPDLGQGACSALEDAVALGQHLGRCFLGNGGKLAAGAAGGALKGYARQRRWRAVKLIVASYLSGWAQQSGTTWWKRALRDSAFYRYGFRFLMDGVLYDCGDLPRPDGAGAGAGDDQVMVKPSKAD